MHIGVISSIALSIFTIFYHLLLLKYTGISHWVRGHSLIHCRLWAWWIAHCLLCALLRTQSHQDAEQISYSFAQILWRFIFTMFLSLWFFLGCPHFPFYMMLCDTKDDSQGWKVFQPKTPRFQRSKALSGFGRIAGPLHAGIQSELQIVAIVNMKIPH